MTTPNTRAHPIVGLHHVALAVRHMASVERFYIEGAGFEPWLAASGLGLALALGLPAGSRSLCGPNAGLVLLPADATLPTVRRPVSEAGIAHICLQTPHIAHILGELKARGASLHSQPIDLGTGFLYCYARDPEANVIEVECVAPVWASPRPWLAHANIVTPDLLRMVAFYGAFLGVAAVRSPRLQGDVRLDTIADLPDVQLRAAWLQAGNAQIELMQYWQPATTPETARRLPGMPGFAHLAFEVSHLAAACAHLQHSGGQLREAPGPGAWQAVGLDPDGNRLVLLDLHAAAHAGWRISALADPHITQRFAAARTALAQSR
jgi:catechol 2,3-dioxygenase-like lactoylglutathione lyase family enzyme